MYTLWIDYWREWWGPQELESLEELPKALLSSIWNDFRVTKEVELKLD